MTFFRITPDRDRPSGLHAFSIFGIPVYIEMGFIFFIGLIFLLQAQGGAINVPQVGLFCIAIFLSLLVHEFGHALVSKALGCDSIRIALIMFGGYATHSPTTRGKSLVIALSGPMFGYALGIAAAILFFRGGSLHEVGADGAMSYFLGVLLLINILWSTFNLLPIHPLDGGQALYHTLTFWIADNRAILWVARVSIATCVIVGIAALRFNPIITLFCAFFFMNNLQMMRAAG